METPFSIGIEKRTILEPEGGWKPHTHYIVDVGFSHFNVIHRNIFYSGFLSTYGEPQGYNKFLSSEDGLDISNAYYVKVLAEINIDALSFKCFE